MPDSQRKTISASQTAALFNASPYITRWMLYHYLRGAPENRAESDRMRWGKRLQPLVLEQVATDLKLEVTPNFHDAYVTDGKLLGYTGDALIYNPDRGHGAVEAKCVFDYRVWMTEWAGGKAPPRWYELQLQHQLAVGDGTMPFEWGVIAAWVCGEMHYFERSRDDAVVSAIADEARAMMAAVQSAREPEPFGAGAEAPLLAKLFPIVPGKELDLRADPKAQEWALLAAAFDDFRTQKLFYEKAGEDARNRLRALIRDNATVLLPQGVTLRVSSRNVKEQVITRKAYTTTTIDVEIGAEPNRQAPALPDGAPV